ncbi:MAG: class I SAM-dependent methyltransferase [Clostridia bacterium]|nr:class I SAM-dependent methyltransferase [Clostridia bacterium]
MDEVIKHYDKLIEENNDPVFDSPMLKEYMDGWDGQRFIDEMRLDRGKSVLEIGCGTGRLAVRVCPLVRSFTGVDISPKTVERAKENLNAFSANVILGDFMTLEFKNSYDVIYSSLTFMHVIDKKSAIKKAYSLLKEGGIFALSVDLSQNTVLDYGSRKIALYPNNYDEIYKDFINCGFTILKAWKTDRAGVVIAQRQE